MITYPEELSGNYTIDPTHSRFGFVARHAMVTKVRGQFNTFEGTATVDAANPENSTVAVTLKADSVETGNEQRDEHLRTNDFFDSATWPELKFESTRIEPTETGFNVTGNLTIKDQTQEIVIPLEYGGNVTDPWGNTRIGFEGNVTVNRKDWNLTWNNPLDGGGLLVSEKIVLEFDISATKNS